MKNPGNHKKNMDNLLISITKFFGLDNDAISLSKLNRFFDEEDYKNLIVLSYDCLDLNLFDKHLSEDSFLVKHKFFNITVPQNDEEGLRHLDLLNRINSVDGCKAYGIFPFGTGAYDDLEEAHERIVNLSGGNDKRLIYASFRGQYAADETGIKKINDDCYKLCERLDNSVVLVISESTDKEKKVPVCVIKRMLNSERVREFKMSDMEEVSALLKEKCNSRINARADVFSTNFFPSKNDFYNYSSRTNTTTCLVYEICEKVVGFILFKFDMVSEKQFLKDRAFLSIDHIYVKEEYRRRKIATKLYNEACNYGKKMRVKRIEFEVWECEQDLLAFVHSLNFKVLSQVYENNLN